jgi:hypothetical protein
MSDLRFALRQLANRPGFTAAAVSTLALGFEATTAIASLADGVLFRRPTLRESDRLAMSSTTCHCGVLAVRRHTPTTWITAIARRVSRLLQPADDIH